MPSYAPGACRRSDHAGPRPDQTGVRSTAYRTRTLQGRATTRLPVHWNCGGWRPPDTGKRATSRPHTTPKRHRTIPAPLVRQDREAEASQTRRCCVAPSCRDARRGASQNGSETSRYLRGAHAGRRSATSERPEQSLPGGVAHARGFGTALLVTVSYTGGRVTCGSSGARRRATYHSRVPESVLSGSVSITGAPADARSRRATSPSSSPPAPRRVLGSLRQPPARSAVRFPL
jgi:hypothetical protein